MGKKFDKDVVLSMPITVFLGTVDGVKPRVAPVWFIWEEECLWMLGDKQGSSVKQITGNPECAVEIVHFQVGEGILLLVGMRGKTKVENLDEARFKRLLKKYLGEDEKSWNVRFIDNIARIEDENGRMIKLCTESVFTNNVSYFKTGPMRLEKIECQKTPCVPS